MREHDDGDGQDRVGDDGQGKSVLCAHVDDHPDERTKIEWDVPDNQVQESAPRFIKSPQIGYEESGEQDIGHWNPGAPSV